MELAYRSDTILIALHTPYNSLAYLGTPLFGRRHLPLSLFLTVCNLPRSTFHRKQIEMPDHPSTPPSPTSVLSFPMLHARHTDVNGELIGPQIRFHEYTLHAEIPFADTATMLWNDVDVRNLHRSAQPQLD